MKNPYVFPIFILLAYEPCYYSIKMWRTEEDILQFLLIIASLLDKFMLRHSQELNFMYSCYNSSIYIDNCIFIIFPGIQIYTEYYAGRNRLPILKGEGWTFIMGKGLYWSLNEISLLQRNDQVYDAIGLCSLLKNIEYLDVIWVEKIRRARYFPNVRCDDCLLRTDPKYQHFQYLKKKKINFV